MAARSGNKTPSETKPTKPVATASGKSRGISSGIVFQWEDVFVPVPRKHKLANSFKIKSLAGNTYCFILRILHLTNF